MLIYRWEFKCPVDAALACNETNGLGDGRSTLSFLSALCPLLNKVPYTFPGRTILGSFITSDIGTGRVIGLRNL